MTKLLQTFVDGIAVGSLYALIALGYTMVYGILQFINFAHSDIFMLGAWVSFVLARAMGWTSPDVDIPLWAGPFVLVGAMAICGTLGFTIERLAYRPLRSAPPPGSGRCRCARRPSSSGNARRAPAGRRGPSGALRPRPRRAPWLPGDGCP